jgi:hypothetical protein
MDTHIFIALVGALINAGLSVIVPCMIKKTNQPFLTQVRKVYETNRELILTSSLIIAITIYLSLKVSIELNPNISDLYGINFESSTSPTEFNRQPYIVDRNNNQLQNLVKLMNSK